MRWIMQPTRMFVCGSWYHQKTFIIGYATRWTTCQKQPYQLNSFSWIHMFDVCTTTTSTQFRKFSFVASLFVIWYDIILQLIAHTLPALMGISFFSLGFKGQKLQVKVLVPSDGCIYSLQRCDAPNTDHFYCNSTIDTLLIINTEQFQGQDLDWDGEEDSMPFANPIKETWHSRELSRSGIAFISSPNLP